MRTTEFASAAPSSQCASQLSLASTPSYGPPTEAPTWKQGWLEGQDFVPQPDGTLRCPADHPLYPQERRPERDGTLRVVYAARIGHCRACPLREHCQWHGTSSKKPRRKSRGAASTKLGPQARRTTPDASCDLPHPMGRLAASLPSARVGEAPSEPSCRRPTGSNIPTGSPPASATSFPCTAGTLATFVERRVSLAMPHRLPRLPSRSPFLAYRRPLPKRSDSRRPNTTSEPPSWLVPSSVRTSFPSGSSRSLFHAVLLSLHYMLVVLLLPLSAMSPGGASWIVFE